MTKKLTLAWAAGFIDGEGCLHVCRGLGNGFVSHVPVLTVSQLSRGPLELLQVIFNGGNIGVQKTKNTKQGWQWRLRGQALFPALKRLLPYLTVKKAEAGFLLQNESLWPVNLRRKKLSLEIKQQREWVWKTMKEMK